MADPNNGPSAEGEDWHVWSVPGTSETSAYPPAACLSVRGSTPTQHTDKRTDRWTDDR